MAEVGLRIAGAIVLGEIANALLNKKVSPVLDNRNPTLAMRGSFVPLLIGRRRVGPVVLWVGDRTVVAEANAGGKGVTGSGSQQLVYRESAWHALCVGPARKLHTIYENDKVIWKSSDVGEPFKTGITPESHPSGSAITVASGGTFRIYWGEQDQPVNDFLGGVNADLTQRIGYVSRHKFLCYILWIQKRTGGSAAWGTIEYDIERHPYKVGDLDAYHGPYEGVGGLPDRLSDSVGWFQNGVGGTGNLLPILRAIDGVPGGSPEPQIKVQGDHSLEFQTGGVARILGNSAFVDGLHDVEFANFNPTDTLLQLTGVYISVAGANPNFDAWTMSSGITSITVAVTTSGQNPPPPNARQATGVGDFNARYIVNLNPLFFGTREISYEVTGAGDQFLSPGVNHFRMWVRGFGVAGFNAVAMRLDAYDHPTLSDRSHTIQFVASMSGTPTYTTDNGAYGTMVLVGQTGSLGQAYDWWQIDFYYQSGTGSLPSDENWKRRIVLPFDVIGASFIAVYANDYDSLIEEGLEALLADDDGTLITGITTIQLDDVLSGSSYSGGTIEGFLDDLGPDGANIAHMIDEWFFETFPHGCGLPRALFNMDSLEALGVTLGVENEGLRAHVLIEGGDTLEKVMQAIQLEAGIMIPWNSELGQFEFKLVRDPGADPVDTIPSEALESPRPQIVTVLDSITSDKKSYYFKDRDYAYRDQPITLDDDGRASMEQNQNAKRQDLEIVTDFLSAEQVANRLEQHDLSPPTNYEIWATRGARTLKAGYPLFVEGIVERLRILEVGPVATDSSKIKISAFTDIYTPPEIA